MRTQSIDPKISAAFKNIDMNTYEVLVWDLYHIKTLTGAQDGSITINPSLSYFQLKTGQPDDNGQPTTYEDTNMEVPGQIGTPYKFWGQNIKAFILPAKTDDTPLMKAFDKLNLNKSFVNDAGKILSRGVVTLSVLNQPVARIAPIMAIPAGMGASVASVQGFDVDAISASVSNGWAVASNDHAIDLYLENQISFDFKAEFPGGVFPLYNTLRLGFRIGGFLVRPRQGGK
jgi:hypothetical protein